MILKALRSVIPRLAPMSRRRTPGSWATSSRTRAWLVRKVQLTMRTGYLIPEKNYQFLDADVGCGQGPDVSGPLRSASRATGELMNMDVINLIVCAHDARAAAHRLT